MIERYTRPELLAGGGQALPTTPRPATKGNRA
jgi:hypothetical protein